MVIFMSNFVKYVTSPGDTREVESRATNDATKPAGSVAPPSVDGVAERSLGVLAKSSLIDETRWLPFAPVAVATAIACVAYADYLAKGFSLSYLYILPLVVAAILLPRRISFTLTLICVFLHDLLRPAYTSIHVRIADNLIALIGFGFAVAVTHNFTAQRNRLSELTRRQRDNLLKDVELAADVQRLFLPVNEPAIPGFEIAGMMHPARGVGGDYYDYIPLSNSNLGLIIADVAGKGVAAALLMAATAAAVRVEANEPRRMSETIGRLNRELHGLSGGSRFVTMFLGELDTESRLLGYANCGHNPALLFRAADAEARWLFANCMPVGLFPLLNCEPEQIALEAGDVLVCYTDGLTEAENQAGEEFGRSKIFDIVRANRNARAQEIVDLLYQAVINFSGRDTFDDDLTIMVVKVESARGK
jgi:serine phosphatase RsbU (regulator of sigma subunit)